MKTPLQKKQNLVRVKRYQDKQAERGLVSVRIYVPADRVEDIKTAAARMRGRKPKPPKLPSFLD